MTLAVQSYDVSYNGNGILTSFSITQTYWENSQIKVYLRDENVSPVTETLWVDGVDYNIVAPNVIAVAAPIVGEKVVIVRELDIEQELDLIAAGVFPVEVIESTLDRIVAICQQLQGGIDRAYQTAITATGGSTVFPAPEADKVIGWNSAATLLENKDNAASINFIGETVVGLVNNSNVNFTVSQTPIAGSFILFGNGIRLKAGTDYNRVGTAITMLFTPNFGVEIEANYAYL